MRLTFISECGLLLLLPRLLPLCCCCCGVQVLLWQEMPPMTLGLESAHPPHCSTAACSARPLHITADVTYIRSLHVRLWLWLWRSLWELGSLVCSPLGMITLVYHKEYSKCLKLSKFQKRSVAKKIHESLTTARTLDIYNPDSSIHCYFRLLASQPAREGKVMCGWSVGARQKLLFFFPWH